MVDMEKAVKFCTVALEALTHGKTTFKCPLCGKAAHVERTRLRLRAGCEGCEERIE